MVDPSLLLSINQNRKQIIVAIVGIILGFAVANYPPPQGLDVRAMRCLGIMAWAICWWVFSVLPEYVTAMLMAASFVVFAQIPTETVFASFSSSTWWILVTALALGVGMAKSGILTRIAFATLRIFPKSFKGLIIGLMGVGVITGPLIPSLSAKSAMLTPVAMAISDALGFERKGREASALFLAMFTGIRNAAPVFLSASAIGYLLHGLYPPYVQDQFTMGYWFFCALPWGVAISILNYFAIIIRYKPNNGYQLDMSFLTQKIASFGSMNTKEIVMSIIITLTVLLWVTEPLHGIPAHVVGMIGVCCALASGAYKRQDFRSSIAWDSLIFIGIAMNLSTVFTSLHINEWVVSLFGPIMQQLVVNPYLMVIGLALITVLVRFILVSELAYVSIFMAFLVPIAVQMGINPWVVGMVIYCMLSPWLVSYQNALYLIARYSTQDEMVKHREMARFCIIYLINCLIALLVSVPFWQYLNLLQ